MKHQSENRYRIGRNVVHDAATEAECDASATGARRGLLLIADHEPDVLRLNRVMPCDRRGE